ncbi:anti-sigma-D factor RsdA [Actinokineospora sp. NBRC 105648]|uniref:anti-sigma-D factor RsdA n=1 Tax=Actinokineospora sp. NBRC 105648 TaxID=3032206 RepID=UPI0024A31FD1|nr:anti-sigma-D factor RsdA [Actinokineospora sp. NBRC 105648]GLZ42092.1 hypothetical protein Acsp05_57160 [Actinokineospora sp. NBRC 105648]
MPDQSDRDERGVDEVTSSPPARGEHSNVTPVAFGSGLRLDDEYDLDQLADLEDSDDAVDISRVHADDAFLDALGAAVRGDRGTGGLGGLDSDLPDDIRDDDLAALLTSWRDEVDSTPIGELVDTKLAVATVFAAKHRKRRRPRLLVPFAAAAAVLAIAFTGAGLAARDAQPGDTLWGLTKVLYADHARSVEAAASVRQDLDIAQTALAEGKVAEAKSKLEDAQKGLPAIANEDGAAELAATHADLVSQLPGAPANGVQLPPSASPSTAPPAPTTQQPSSVQVTVVPVPPVTTQPTTTPPAPTTEPTTQPTTTTAPEPSDTPTQPQSEAPRVNEPGSSPVESGQGQPLTETGTTTTSP